MNYSLTNLLGLGILIFISGPSVTQGQADIKFLLVTESVQSHLNDKFSDGFKKVESSTSDTFTFEAISFKRKDSDAAHTEMCQMLQTGEYSAVIDMAWGGWIKGRKTANELGLPYIRVESANPVSYTHLTAADE